MDKKEMSMKEVLEEIRDNLNDITLPMRMMESEGSKIYNAINMLQICIKALENVPPAEVKEDV